jgi:uncharacterized protein, PH0010 family
MTDGVTAVRIARAVISAETRGSVAYPKFPVSFNEYKGVFVTLKEYPSGDLRGCIGYPEPVFPLKEALVRSAISACHDPRFPDLRSEETVTVEVTLLSRPVPASQDKEQLLNDIEIGVHGLIIEHRGRRGLLLPQVPVEWNWSKEEYLAHLSMKAGLPKDAWKFGDSKIYMFTGMIFKEKEPEGDVVSC